MDQDQQAQNMRRWKIYSTALPATSPATAKLAAEEDPCSLGRHANFLPGISPTKELHEIASTNQAVKAGRLSSPSHIIKKAQGDLQRIERSDTLEVDRPASRLVAIGCKLSGAVFILL